MNYASCFHEILCQGYLDLGRTRTWPAFLSCPEVMARYSGTELLVMVGKSVLEGGGLKDDGLHVMVVGMDVTWSMSFF